jgi:hypothetical protein
MAASATAGGIVPEAILVNGSVQFSFTHSPSQPNIVDGNAGTASNAIRHLRQEKTYICGPSIYRRPGSTWALESMVTPGLL